MMDRTILPIFKAKNCSVFVWIRKFRRVLFSFFLFVSHALQQSSANWNDWSKLYIHKAIDVNDCDMVRMMLVHTKLSNLEERKFKLNITKTCNTDKHLILWWTAFAGFYNFLFGWKLCNTTTLTSKLKNLCSILP